MQKRQEMVVVKAKCKTLLREVCGGEGTEHVNSNALHYFIFRVAVIHQDQNDCSDPQTASCADL